MLRLLTTSISHLLSKKILGLVKIIVNYWRWQVNWCPTPLSNFRPPTEPMKSCQSPVTRCYSLSPIHFGYIQGPSKPETQIQLKLNSFPIAEANLLLVTVFHLTSVFHLKGYFQSIALPLLLIALAPPLTATLVLHVKLAPPPLVEMDFDHKRAILAPKVTPHSVKLAHLVSHRLHFVELLKKIVFVTVHVNQPQQEIECAATQAIRQLAALAYY